MAYIIVFSLTTFLTYVYEHSGKKRNERYLHRLLAILIVLIPSLLGGLRDISVGTDNVNYNVLFQVCHNRSLIDVINSRYLPSFAKELEIGFRILTWLLSRLGDNYFFFAFGTSLLTFGFFFGGATYYKDRYPVSVIVLSYLFIYYCSLYNYVRQGIALAIVFFGLRYVEKDQFIKFCIVVILASTIHISALIAIFVYAIFKLKSAIKFNKYVFIIVLLFVWFVLFGQRYVLRVFDNLAQLGIWELHLSKYTERIQLAGSAGIYRINDAAMAFPQLLVTTVFCRELIQSDEAIKGYYIMCWAQAALILLGSFFGPLLRLSLYFNLSEFVLFAALIKYFSKTRLKVISYILLVCFLLLYWTFFAVMNYYGYARPVYPYIFAFK